MNQAQKQVMLRRRGGMIDIVLDTDTFNEVDDQYALSYLLHSEDRLRLRAIYAAPFANEKAATPREGMEKSYDEILHILKLNGRSDLNEIVYRGSTRYLPDEKTPVISPAAEDMVERSRDYDVQNPLVIVAIGAITNVASAILLDPTILERVVIVWLGGNCNEWHDYHEFNLEQDVAAARIVLSCGGAIVQIPAYGVASSLTTPMQECEYWLRGKGELCEYLLDITLNEMAEKVKTGVGSRKIWDISTIAYLLDTDGTVVLDRETPAPLPEYDHGFTLSDDRPTIRQVYYFDRDRVFRDLYTKLTRGK